MDRDLASHIVSEFSSEETQCFYRAKATSGLWHSETIFIQRYFTRKDGSVLDLGCGTGRTTIPLVRRGYNVIGVDITPKMIANASMIAREQKLKIDYRTGDATSLEFDDKTFDYVLFSNQGWTQIPGRENRIRALKEIHRVLADDGVFIFSTHQRSLSKGFVFFWIRQWVRFYILKRLGLRIPELEYGDRFFARETLNGYSKDQQYVHIPTVKEVERDLEQTGFQIIEINTELQISDADVRRKPPVLYACRRADNQS